MYGTFCTFLNFLLCFQVFKMSQQQQSAPQIKPKRSKDGKIFASQNFYLDQFELCTNCPSTKLRPNHPHHHCLICHLNIKSPNRKFDINFNLKSHFVRSFQSEKNLGFFPLHDLSNPPRIVSPSSFAELSPAEKTIVREGKVTFYFLHFIFRNVVFPIFSKFVFVSASKLFYSKTTFPICVIFGIK